MLNKNLAEKEQAIEQLLTEKDRLAGNIADQQEKIGQYLDAMRNLERQLNESRRENNRFSAENSSLANSIARLQDEISALNLAREEKGKALKDDLSSYGRAVADLQLRLEQSLHENAELRANLKAAQSAVQEALKPVIEKKEEPLRVRVEKGPAINKLSLAYALLALFLIAGIGVSFYAYSRLGFTGVLHTWGRTLTYHPHVHFIVPGGALSADGEQWLPSRLNFLVPVQAASVIYRAKFQAIMRERGLHAQIPPVVWTKDWVVHSQAVGDGRVALRYLAPYVYRVAINNRRIVKCEPGPDGLGRVTFTYRPSGSRRYRAMTVTAEEFIRRFLQHVLPRGLQKVRHYGFAHPRSRIDLDIHRRRSATNCRPPKAPDRVAPRNAKPIWQVA